MALMGFAGKPHGLGGEIVAKWHGETWPEPGMSLFFQTGDLPPAPRKILAVRAHKGQPLISVEGVGDRSEAEKLQGARLFLQRSECAPLEEGEAYLEDLFGAKIFLADGTFLGVLDHAEFPAGREIWSIRTPQDREVLFPADPAFILDIDASASTVHIDPPAGLLDIYLA